MEGSGRTRTVVTLGDGTGNEASLVVAKAADVASV